MRSNARFNYIITIHNKEDLLERTLQGVLECCSSGATIYPVLDGCTDRSESIVDSFVANANVRVEKIIASDVHETLSINAALERITRGFTVILQDDVILQEPGLETNISNLYKRMGPRLGVISFRFAVNVFKTPIIRQLRCRVLSGMIMEDDLIQRPDDCGGGLVGEFYSFYPRMVAIKGPNVIPEQVRLKVGLLDPKLAPYSYDDDDYCLRAMKEGFVNGLFPVHFESKLDWGGTRRDSTFLNKSKQIHLRNRRHNWRLHGVFIKKLLREGRVCQGPEPVFSLDTITNQFRSI